MSLDKVNISYGLRVGFWKPGTGDFRQAFQCKGIYTGPNLGTSLPGSRFEQKLIEGTLEYRIGVLFRPDLGRNQRLETILILEKVVPEMWEYADWQLLEGEM